MTENTPIDYT